MGCPCNNNESVITPVGNNCGCEDCANKCGTPISADCITLDSPPSNCAPYEQGDSLTEVIGALSAKIPTTFNSSTATITDTTIGGCRTVNIEVIPPNVIVPEVCIQSGSDFITVVQEDDCTVIGLTLPDAPSDSACRILKSCSGNQSWVEPGDITSSTPAITITNGDGVLASNVTAQVDLTTGDLTESGSNVLTITGGTDSQVGGNTTIQVKTNALNQDGVVPAPTSSNANKVYSTDASGNPGWGDLFSTGTFDEQMSLGSVNISNAAGNGSRYFDFGSYKIIEKACFVTFTAASLATSFYFTIPFTPLSNGGYGSYVIGTAMAEDGTVFVGMWDSATNRVLFKGNAITTTVNQKLIVKIDCFTS